MTLWPHGLKRGEGCCAPFKGELGPHLTQCGLRRGIPLYQMAYRCIQPFGHKRHGPKSGGAMPLFTGSWIPILHNVASAEVYLPTKWHLDPSSHLATTDMGRKLGAVPLLEGARFPSNTMCPGPRPTSTPSFILMHPTVWPQYTNITGRQTDRRGQQSDSMGQTVL